MNLRLIPALLLLLAAPWAQAQVYKCVDADGAVTYTNDRASARGCSQLSQDLPVSSVPPPVKRTSPPTQGTPADFPRVAPAAQRARDDTRRQVLEKELAAEEAALALARKALAEHEAITRDATRRAPAAEGRIRTEQEKIDTHRRNIDALQEEIANLK